MLQAGTDADVWFALEAIGRRLVYLPALVLYNYFEVFPEQVGHLYGLTIGKLAWFVGGDNFNSANYVYQYMYPERVESGLANAAFVGNLWADFGFAGVLVGGVVAGAIMQFLQVTLVREKKDVLSVAIYSYLIFAFWLLSSTALPVVLLSNGVILIFALRFAVRVFESMATAVTFRAHERFEAEG